MTQWTSEEAFTPTQFVCLQNESVFGDHSELWTSVSSL